MDNKPEVIDPSELLTLCMPTYNRVVNVCEALEDIIPKIKPYNFRLIVVDNCSPDNTRKVVEAYQGLYDRLEYFGQDENKGYDINFETALKLAKTPYCWVIGDGNRLQAQNFPAIVKTLSEQMPDIYIVDEVHRALSSFPPKVYTDASDLLHDLGWHMTLLSSTIFSQKIIQMGNFEKYRNTHFLHLGVVFDSLARLDKFTAVWSGLDLIHGSMLPKGNSWNPGRVMEIFGGAWTELILSLPDNLSMEAKRYCIAFHGKKTRLFGKRHLKKQRAAGGLDYSIYKKYEKYIPYFAPGKRFRILIYSFYPNFLNRYYWRNKRYIRKTGKPLF